MTDQHIVVVDVETNGRDPERHQAVEVAWWNLTTDERGCFIPRHHPQEVLFHAEIDALRVNRYIDRIAGQPQDLHSDELLRLHAQFYDYDEDRTHEDGGAAEIRHTLAGKNPAFDARFLANLFARNDVTEHAPTPWSYRLLDLSGYAHGVLRLPLDEPLLSLRDLCGRLGVEPGDHTADGDVTATGSCFRHLARMAAGPAEAA
jgi:DNA polymerase-3 subunit epsilon